MRVNVRRLSKGGTTIHFVLFLIVLLHATSVRAAVDRPQLGAQFDNTGSHVTFRVYSSRATRVELYLYAAPTGVDEAARLPLTVDATASVWSTVVTMTQMQQFGIRGAIYYGYRAWGPNWKYDPTWTRGSKNGFIGDVDSDGNRFNPNKLLTDPYARELSHDPETPGQRDGTAYASGPTID